MIDIYPWVLRFPGTSWEGGGWGVGGGWGWWRSLHLHTCIHTCVMLGKWWGGDDDVPCTCTHVWCYASGGWGVGMMTFPALAHMYTHVWCYASDGVGMMTFLALAHMCDATQVVGWWVGGGDDDVPCTCTDVYTCVMLRKWWDGDDDVPCTCTHLWCYASDGVVGGELCVTQFHTLKPNTPSTMLKPTRFGILYMMRTRKKSGDCDLWPFSTSFRFTAPANVFEATRKNTLKNIWFLKQILHHGHATNAKKQLTHSLCHFPQASNLPRLPVFLKPHASYVKKHMILTEILHHWHPENFKIVVLPQRNAILAFCMVLVMTSLKIGPRGRKKKWSAR